MKKKLVYILGHSRSGSTVLNTILGSVDGVFSAGELNKFCESGLLRNDLCSCKQPVQTCSFWKVVVSELGLLGESELCEVCEFFKLNELWKKLPKFFSRKIDAEKHERYLEFNKVMLRGIFKQSGANTVIDASKNPIRLKNLMELKDEYEVKGLRVVRDPRAVCWSLKKSLDKDPEKGIQFNLPGKSFLSTVKSLYVREALIAWVRYLHGQEMITLRYEDLMAFPRSELSRVGKFLNVDFGEAIARMESDGRFIVYHNLAGNRLRMNESISVRADKSWREEIDMAQYCLVSFLTLPLLLAYRYQIVGIKKAER